MYALADAYQWETGELLPITWDFSHLAVVKRLASGNYRERLLVWPDLIQSAQQFHFRPFNGHHAQVPIAEPNGSLSPEMREWMPFAEAVLACWMQGNRGTDREIFVCPEPGPRVGGYGLSAFQNSWEDTMVLRREIKQMWARSWSPS